jgi:hypothetical protein
VVVDHVEEHLDLPGVGVVHQGLQLLFGAEARVHPGEVVGPVAVIAPVGKAGAGDEAVDLVHRRGDPDRGHP